jgi:hypothetical protein
MRVLPLEQEPLAVWEEVADRVVADIAASEIRHALL